MSNQLTTSFVRPQGGEVLESGHFGCLSLGASSDHPVTVRSLHLEGEMSLSLSDKLKKVVAVSQRKSRSFPAGGADYPAATFLAGKWKWVV